MKKRQANRKLQLMVKVIRDLKPSEGRNAAGGSNNRPPPDCTSITHCGQTYGE